MRTAYLIIMLTVLTDLPVFAQARQLVPSMRRPVIGIAEEAPDYGELLTAFQQEVRMWADIACQRSLRSTLQSKIDSVRSLIRTDTTFLVIANITNRRTCNVSTFRPAYRNENPSALSDAQTRLLVYTIKIYPWIEINGRRY